MYKIFRNWFRKQFGLIEFLPIYEHNLPIKKSNKKLPANTRYLIDKDYGTIVIESLPQKRTIFLSGYRKAHLYFPYTYFVINFVRSKSSKKSKYSYFFTGISVGFSEKPLANLNEEVTDMPLANYLGGLEVCLGKVCFKADNLCDLVDLVIAYYWQSRFENAFSLSLWKNITKYNPIEIGCLLNLFKRKRPLRHLISHSHFPVKENSLFKYELSKK